jgi:predicted nucleic acid-binding protein
VTYLIDTNVISELCRTKPNQGVLAWADDVTQFAVSVISVEEIFFGLAWHPNGRVLKWMEVFFQRHQVLPISQNIAHYGGTLRGQLTARGIIREQADMLIAATAQAHQLTLVTHNTRDFQNCGIGLLNPFNGSGPCCLK